MRPPGTRLSDGLRQRPGLLQELEARRLRTDAPSTIDLARDRIEASLAGLDSALAKYDASAWPEGAVSLAERAGELAIAVIDLLAAVVQADEAQDRRYPVPLTSAPGMIDAFSAHGFRVPADMADSWRIERDPLATWRRILDPLLDQADRGVRHSRAGSTIYHASEQSNQAPIVEVLAHVLSLLIWLQEAPMPAPD